MTCTHLSNGTVEVFICGRKTTSERCSCGRPVVANCDFALRGPKAGTKCDKPLCQWCAVRRGEQTLCQAHGRMAP